MRSAVRPTPRERARTPERWLLSVLARASDPRERRSGGWLVQADDTSGASRYRTWLDLVAGGDQTRGADILRQRGLRVDEFVRSLENAQVVAGAALPDWAVATGELIDRLSHPGSAAPADAPLLAELAGAGLPDWVDGSTPWRLYAGFAAWMHHASHLVRVWSAPSAGLLAPAAQRELVLCLPRTMLTSVGPRLMSEAEARPSGQQLFRTDPKRDWQEILTRFPVMARVLAVSWRQWQDTTKEIIERLTADLPALAPGARVAALVPGAGDRHANGRSVTQVVLDSGRRFYLKPRPVGPYRMLRATLDAVDAHGDRLGLRLPSVTARSGYAWSEHLDPEDCADESEVSAYFHRAGALLRILQAVGATDLHQENFIPTRTGPVLVDLETVMNADSGWDARFQPAAGAGPNLADTPAATSMVTSMVDGPPGTASIDIGAMAGPAVRPTPYAVPNLVRTSTGPRLRGQRLPQPTGMALPRLQGTAVPLRGHVSDVVAGYREAARRLAALADLPALLDADCRAEPVRLVPRATQVYSRLLQQSCSDRALSDGVERELILERLWLATGTCPVDLIEAEQEALRDLDVPLFTVGIGSTDLVSDRGRVIPSALVRTPAQEALRRFRPGGRRTGAGR